MIEAILSTTDIQFVHALLILDHNNSNNQYNIRYDVLLLQDSFRAEPGNGSEDYIHFSSSILGTWLPRRTHTSYNIYQDYSNNSESISMNKISVRRSTTVKVSP